MTQIPLIHPIYLDVPMLVSFAAAIDGGLSFGAEVTQEKESKESHGGTVSAKIGFSNLFSSLFDASVGGNTSEEESGGTHEVYRESRAHTEASIAIMLYDRLRREKGYLVVPSEPDELVDLEMGSLVELTGVIKKNAVDSIIELIEVSSILSDLSKSTKPESKKDVQRIRQALDADRKRTPISNALLTCSKPLDLTAVVTLRTSNLRDLTLSELHKNMVRVVGKVTRSIREGEVMSAFENYGLSLIQPEKLKELFEMVKTGALRPEFSDVEVHGPAVQVLPLMIFV